MTVQLESMLTIDRHTDCAVSAGDHSSYRMLWWPKTSIGMR